MWMDRERRGKETLEELQRTFQRNTVINYTSTCFMCIKSFWKHISDLSLGELQKQYYQ